jgi:hypothetical protein
MTIHAMWRASSARRAAEPSIVYAAGTYASGRNTVVQKAAARTLSTVNWRHCVATEAAGAGMGEGDD